VAGKQIHLPVVLFGTAARGLVDAVFEKTAQQGAETIDHPQAEGPHMSYLPMRLGDIRGFKTLLHLYGFDPDPHIGPLIARYAAAAAGAVLAFHAAPDDGARAAFAAIARSVPPKTPVAALGPPEVAKLWMVQHDTPAVFTGDAEDGSIMPAIKAVAREMLASLRSG